MSVTRYIERLIVKKMIASALAQGFKLSVYDGEALAIVRSTDAEAIEKAMFSTDEDRVFFHNIGGGSCPDCFFDTENDELAEAEQPTDYIGWVYLVYGNDGPDVICDYTTNLETALAEATALGTEIEEAQ